MESQLSILTESLDEKIRVMDAIKKYNEEQQQIFQDNQVKLEDFDEAVERKGQLIEKLTRLDDGFELLYARVEEELKNNRQRYATQIQELQEKVKLVMDMSVTLQAQEARNKALIEAYFAKERSDIRQGRKSSTAAYNYYKNMTGSSYETSQYMDSKK